MALLHAHPNVYVDIAGLQSTAITRVGYLWHLQRLVENEFARRIMFGSDSPNQAASGLTLERAPRLILGMMAERCCPEPKAIVDAAVCPTCRGSSKPVDSVTVKALLTPAALQRFQPRDYRFCAAPDCEVVYFAEAGPTFVTNDLRERAWQKEPPGQRTICYCFGENEGDIAAEIGRTGASQAVARVRAHIAAGRCACEIRNPKGACCLGDVIAAVERMRMTTTGAGCF